jgi:hypothetical protein
MEQVRLQEEKQLIFRREIRDQIDDAVLALPETHRVLVEKADRIARLLTTAAPLTRPEVSMEASLTGRMMGTTRATVTAEIGKMPINAVPHPSSAEELAQQTKAPAGIPQRPPGGSTPPILVLEELRRR